MLHEKTLIGILYPLCNDTSDGINPEGYLTISAPKNPGLKWEKNYTSNIALEFGFLKRRIYGTLEYYYKKGASSPQKHA